MNLSIFEKNEIIIGEIKPKIYRPTILKSFQRTASQLLLVLALHWQYRIATINEINMINKLVIAICDLYRTPKYDSKNHYWGFC